MKYQLTNQGERHASIKRTVRSNLRFTTTQT